MSEAGAALQVVSPLYIPDRMVLFILIEQSKRACRDVWRTASPAVDHANEDKCRISGGTRSVLFGTLLAMFDDSLTNQMPKCERCGQTTSLLYSYVDPTSGQRVRTYQCKTCRDETVLPVSRPEESG
jgi:hypothetical protein